MKMREIADAAGVSLTAVSLVLNGKPGIGDEKRALVTRLLQENGYQIRPEDAPQRIHAHSNLCFLKYSKHSYLVNGNPGFVTQIMDAAGELFDRITDKSLLIRRLNITATHVIDEASAPSSKDNYEQLDLFTDYAALDAKRKQEDEELAREKKVQQAMLTIKKKFGKNAILKGMNLSEGATAKDRNEQIGGHKA